MPLQQNIIVEKQVTKNTMQQHMSASEVSVVEPDHEDEQQMLCTVGLFVAGAAFPAWASAHLAQMDSWRNC